MSKTEQNIALSSIESQEFIGREREMNTLLQHAKGENKNAGMLILSEPAQGLSELLKQTYDRLFYEQDEIIPVYFEIKSSDKSFKQLAIRFIQTFLEQTTAFRRNDKKILDLSPDICEISELSIPADGHWVDRLIVACTTDSELNDESSFIRQALSSTLRANSSDAKTFVMFDNLSAVQSLSGEPDFIEELKEIFNRSICPYVFAGKRRFLLNAMMTGNTKLDEVEILQLSSHSFKNSGILVNSLAHKRDIEITDQATDLLVQQLNSSPVFVRNFFEYANEKNLDLNTFKQVENAYTEQLFGGQIKAFYDSVFNEVIPSVEIQKQFIDLIYNSLTIEKEKVPIESWRKHISLTEMDFYRAMSLLNSEEVITVTSNMVEANNENMILTDYITKRFRLEIRGDKRALAYAETFSELLKKAPLMMAKHYRRKSSIGIKNLLTTFDCQEIPISLIFYNVYKELHKGKDSEKILEDVSNDPEKLSLPQIVWTANTVAFYPSIDKLTEKERSAVALGFEAAEYTDENEIVWIAAEVDSKLEANADVTRFWCDRLEVVALMCDFTNYRLWLISPEGFSPEATEVLNERNAVGSSRQQVELLAKYLNAEELINKRSEKNQFEMVIPMGDDTELIAAYAVEELARRHSFETKAINQIKTALVEACINATEHSHSPDRKIYQKFIIEDNKISITISNRGLRFNGNKSEEIAPNEGRRGWGLKLMRSLMDEVKFEKVDDGTKISLVKYLTKV